MEAAGLTIGAVALISLFKDCVDLFSMITAARRLGQDAAILETKLDVERMLLLRWSDRVGLLQFFNYDQSSNESLNPSSIQLRDPETQKIVLQVLACIKSLLSEGEALQQSYGLQQFDPSDPHASAVSSSQGASASRLERFLHDFHRLKLNTQNRKSTPRSSGFTDTTKKVRWIIVHQDKFNTLIANLSYFNSSLMELAPTASPSVLSSVQEDLSHVRSVAELDIIIQASADTRPAVKSAAVAVKKAILQRQILQRLWFRHHEDRRFNIKEAHYKTLRWALDPPNGYMERDDLSSWLQDTHSIYWISGKAGSGKSTLMKHLWSQSRILELLNDWAYGSSISLVSFFFYALGRPEQKSQSGLLRSLLYQLLKQDSDSIEIILPNMWQEACTNTDKDPLKLSIPSIDEMTTALFDYCASCNASKKLFFMIDGADEYEGGDLDAVKFITDLGRLPNIKILISSRPHPAYVAAFEHTARLNLPDLTRGDIASYISESIATHPYLITLSEIQPNVVEGLIEELVSKASGVFLWVVLACRSVVEGCNDYCSFSDLQTRIDELPREVEDLLQHMLNKIRPAWRTEAIKLLNIVYTNKCNNDFESIPTLGLHFAYEQGLQVTEESTRAKLDNIPSQQITARCQIMDGLLRSRCCGLLEVQHAEASFSSLNFCVCNPVVFQPHDSLQDSEVVFMHRTVYELLTQPRAWQEDYVVFQNMTLNSHAILSMMWCQLVPMAYVQHSAINSALSHIYHGYKSGLSPETTLRCLSRFQVLFGNVELDAVWSTAKQYLLHDSGCPRCWGDSSIALALAVEMGFTSVIEFVIENASLIGRSLLQAANNMPLCDCGRQISRPTFKPLPRFEYHSLRRIALQTRYPLLYHAVCRPMLRDLYNNSLTPPDYQSTSPNLDMIRYILQLGGSPNEHLQGLKQANSEEATVWTQWIRGDPEILSKLHGSMTLHTMETTKLLLDGDAETLHTLLDKVDVLRRWSIYPGSVDQEAWAEIENTIEGRLERASY
ncbi:prion-inhibition and propagation-domain-containing protein [Fusarium acuminatum]|uniref:Prion-inhibition and propagation-domain-containing protein n=1 Tax=Fusarium acuminatum TaxID=5515 RepID=A0ABZ2WMR3_9HYPO